MYVGRVDGVGVYIVLCEAPWLHIFIYSHDTSTPSTHEEYSFRLANLLLLAVHFIFFWYDSAIIWPHSMIECLCIQNTLTHRYPVGELGETQMNVITLYIFLCMRVSMSVCVGVLPVLAACRCPFVISNLCQWGFQASYWVEWTDQSVCNSPSTICQSLNSPLLWSCTQNEGLCLLPFYLKSTPSDSVLFLATVQSLRLGFRENTM